MKSVLLTGWRHFAARFELFDFVSLLFLARVMIVALLASCQSCWVLAAAANQTVSNSHMS